MILRRLWGYLIIGFALWGVLALGLLLYGLAVSSAPGRQEQLQAATSPPASLAPSPSPAQREKGAEGGVNQPLTEADKQRVEFYQRRGLQPTPLPAATPPPLPSLPLGWEWYEITPNTPASPPPDLVLGLPAGSFVVGEADWIIFWLPDESIKGPNGVGPQFQRGRSCEGMSPTGETWVVAGQPAIVYRYASQRFGGVGALCFEFQYQGAPWRLLLIDVDPTEWELAYHIASLVVPRSR